jgi:regulator of protease activity HflC (stomatin/prohibitin superfamily)
MTTALEIPETKDLEQNIMTLSDKAMTIKVTDDTTLLVADQMETDLKAMRKQIETFFKPLKQKAHDAHKALTTAEATELAKIVPAEQYVKRQRFDYQQEQQRIREAEEARLLKEAQAREEADRLARAAEIEREAAALKASGQVEEAAAVQQEAETVLNTAVPVVPPRMAPAPKTKNAMRMIVDSQRLQTIADMLNKGTTKTPPHIPGVRFYQEWQFTVENASAVPDAYRRPS